MSYEYYFDAFRKYAQFSGRARRSEYWFFVLFNILALFVLGFTGTLFHAAGGGVLAVMYLLVCIVPWLALISRRLHDSGKSGAMFFVAFIPLIGSIWLLILYCTDSEYGVNKYGPNPKGIGNQEEDADNALIQQIGS